MGMTAGTNNRGLVSDPNIVPLIDVLLVLIIIFMVISPPIPTGLPTLVPRPAPPARPADTSDAIVVQVLPGGKLMINHQPSDWGTLDGSLSTIFKRRAEKVAFVEGEKDVPFEEVARAIDVMRGAGVEQVGLMTSAGRS
jgi:biopolymer transport protein TolR